MDLCLLKTRSAAKSLLSIPDRARVGLPSIRCVFCFGPRTGRPQGAHQYLSGTCKSNKQGLRGLPDHSGG